MAAAESALVTVAALETAMAEVSVLARVGARVAEFLTQVPAGMAIQFASIVRLLSFPTKLSRQSTKVWST